MSDPYQNIPEKPPVAPCNGWLVHNRKLCGCYVAERARAARIDAIGFYGVTALFVMWPGLLVLGWAVFG